MKGSIRVNGGTSLNGTVTPIPNKNAVLACVPASILSKETITFENIPNTSDVDKLLDILQGLGASVEIANGGSKRGGRTIKINCAELDNYIVDSELAGKFRSSIMLVGPLLARFGRARVPMPGGCTLGFRSISAHIDGFTKAGIKVEQGEDYAEFVAPKEAVNGSIWLKEASVSGTENLVMYLAGTESQVKVVNAACEPHVRQLEQMLVDMGVTIEGVGSNVLDVAGTDNLGSATFTPEPDFVDIGGFIVAAAVTKGKITLKDANYADVVDGLINFFSKFNIKIHKDGNDIVVDGSNPLSIDPNKSGFPLAGNSLPKVTPEPWPGFPVDVLPVVVTLACKTEGRTLINNWMYENGLDFSRELNTLGAEIFMVDSQKVIVNGPIAFSGGEVLSPGVIQACKAIFLAALADPSETVLHGIDILARRYPDIIDVYKSLGASIEILD